MCYKIRADTEKDRSFSLDKATKFTHQKDRDLVETHAFASRPGLIARIRALFASFSEVRANSLQHHDFDKGMNDEKREVEEVR